MAVDAGRALIERKVMYDGELSCVVYDDESTVRMFVVVGVEFFDGLDLVPHCDGFGHIVRPGGGVCVTVFEEVGPLSMVAILFVEPFFEALRDHGWKVGDLDCR
jgi:hypothetical protein